ncbi:lipoprotein [Planoprotostelium fungivorum]|uniref:Lipoprotein n=1 Tax=Planoprotostelium fungivorum TaxID=1890364 RepID=A0A2P6NZT6_9EUKA|nr:lipoprotein [Planoprotostelium fungivorum]
MRFTIFLALLALAHAVDVFPAVEEMEELMFADIPTTILNLHNQARAAKGIAPLKWNTTIAKLAQSYSDQCKWGHSGRKGYGENIASGASSGAATAYSSQDATGGVNGWNNEKKNWNCASNSCNGVCGHYTQVVWENTKQIGCGFTSCKKNTPFGSSFPNWKYLVCNYAAPGNYVGQRPFPSNKC